MFQSSNAARRVYERNRDKFDTTDKGEYFVNIGLFNNGEISSYRNYIIPIAKELKFTTVEKVSTGDIKLKTRKKINEMIVDLKKNFMILVGQTSAQLSKMHAKEYNKKIEMAMDYERTPIKKLELIEYCDFVIEYCDLLVKTGITPIVAGYEDQTGLKKVFK